MIKHIVFDIGNVLMTFAPETYFIRWFQSEEKTHRVCSRIFTHEAWEKYDQGIWMLEDLYAVYHDAYPDMAEETDIVLQNWLQLMQPMQESIAFMKQMKNAGYGIYILPISVRFCGLFEGNPAVLSTGGRCGIVL